MVNLEQYSGLPLRMMGRGGGQINKKVCVCVVEVGVYNPLSTSQVQLENTYWETTQRFFAELQTLAYAESITAGQWHAECKQPVGVKSYSIPDWKH